MFGDKPNICYICKSVYVHTKPEQQFFFAMKKTSFVFLFVLLASMQICQDAAAARKPKSIYHKGWIDFNKNGRMDIYEDPSKVCVKIIDYKSSDMQLDLDNVRKGLQLQLFVYMKAAMEIEEKENKGREIVPAGLLYYHIDDPLVSPDEEDIDESIRRSLSMKGYVNSDSEIIKLIDSDFEDRSSIIQISRLKGGELSSASKVISTEEFNELSSELAGLIKGMGRAILDGDIKAEPHDKDGIDDKGCRYCPYTDICRFNRSVNT